MLTLMTYLQTMRKDDEGVTAIEYGLIAALMALAITGGVAAAGGALDGLFNQIAGELTF